MKELNKNIFYNYVYLDQRKPGDYDYVEFHFNYKPFYIGKGSNDRMYEHLSEIKGTTHNNKKFYKIQKIRKVTANDPIIFKIYEDLPEQMSLNLEYYLIKTIGRDDLKLGPLTNLTDGGIGGNTLSDIQKENISVKVYQYDLFGNFIKKYKSGIESYKITGILHISHSCAGKQKTAGNYFWSYHKLNKEEIKERLDDIKNNKHNKIVCQYLNGVLIKEYKSIKIATKETGINHISKCCLGKQKTAGGFEWKYL